MPSIQPYQQRHWQRHWKRAGIVTYTIWLLEHCTPNQEHGDVLPHQLVRFFHVVGPPMAL
jgi:hypothetical protein